MKVSDLQAEAAAKYTDLPLELDDGSVIQLRNLLRLDDKARKTAQVLLDSLDSKDDAQKAKLDQLSHQERVLRDLFLLVADKPDVLAPLLDGWDLAMRMHVLETWTESTQLPEAERSAS